MAPILSKDQNLQDHRGGPPAFLSGRLEPPVRRGTRIRPSTLHPRFWGWRKPRQPVPRPRYPCRLLRADRQTHGETRTKAPEAILLLPDLCMTPLKKRRVDRLTDAEPSGEARPGDDFVFITKFGTPVDPRNFNSSFAARCAHAGVRPIRVHDARHTCACWPRSTLTPHSHAESLPPECPRGCLLRSGVVGYMKGRDWVPARPLRDHCRIGAGRLTVAECAEGSPGTCPPGACVGLPQERVISRQPPHSSAPCSPPGWWQLLGSCSFRAPLACMRPRWRHRYRSR